MKTKMTDEEITKLHLYDLARIQGKTVAEAKHMWVQFPYDGTVLEDKEEYDMPGMAGLTLNQAIAKVEGRIKKSPYYNAEQNRIVPPQEAREYT